MQSLEHVTSKLVFTVYLATLCLREVTKYLVIITVLRVNDQGHVQVKPLLWCNGSTVFLLQKSMLLVVQHNTPCSG